MKKKIIIIIVLLILISAGIIFFIRYNKSTSSNAINNHSIEIEDGLIIMNEKYSLDNSKFNYSVLLVNNTNDNREIKEVHIVFYNKDNEILMEYNEIVNKTIKPQENISIKILADTNTISDERDISLIKYEID